jgi:hypothetical protein
MSFSRVSGTGNLPGPATTNESGIWSQEGFQPGTTYRVTPTKADYTFSPAYANFSGESTGLNFAGTPVVPAGIAVTSPDGGESWKPGSSHSITWMYTGNPGSKLKIDLLKGGNLNRTITTKASLGSGGNGYYTWKISPSQVVGNDYTIRITSTTNSSATDTSNANFSIYK